MVPIAQPILPALAVPSHWYWCNYRVTFTVDTYHSITIVLWLGGEHYYGNPFLHWTVLPAQGEAGTGKWFINESLSSPPTTADISNARVEGGSLDSMHPIAFTWVSNGKGGSQARKLTYYQVYPPPYYCRPSPTGVGEGFLAAMHPILVTKVSNGKGSGNWLINKFIPPPPPPHNKPTPHPSHCRSSPIPGWGRVRAPHQPSPSSPSPPSSPGPIKQQLTDKVGLPKSILRSTQFHSQRLFSVRRKVSLWIYDQRGPKFQKSLSDVCLICLNSVIHLLISIKNCMLCTKIFQQNLETILEIWLSKVEM